MGTSGCPPGSLPCSSAGADEAVPHPARCWRCVVLAACWPYFSLLSLFPVFLSCRSCLSQHLWDPRSSVVPICLLCIRAGGKRRWTAFCETPLHVFDHLSSHPVWQSQSHPPGPSPESPVLPEGRRTPFFCALSQRRWHLHSTILLLRDAERTS